MFIFAHDIIPVSYVLHKINVTIPVYADQNPKKGDTWKFTIKLCGLDILWTCGNQDTIFSFYLPIK